MDSCHSRTTLTRMNELGAEDLTDLLVTAVRDLRIGDTDAKRADAARKLGSARSSLAVGYLIEGLSDRSAEVRRAAVEALSEIGDASAVEPLRSLLEKEIDPLLQSNTIVAAIAKIRAAETAETSEGFMKPTISSLPAGPKTDPEDLATRSDRSDMRAQETLQKAFNETPAGLRAEDARQRLEDTYRRAAAQRQLIEKARRQSIEE